MTTTVRAVYEKGVLRPDRPLPLAEGEAVEVTVATAAPEEDDVLRRMKAAKTLDELFAIADSVPAEDDGYDVIRAMNETRLANGERLLTVDDQSGARQ